MDLNPFKMNTDTVNAVDEAAKEYAKSKVTGVESNPRDTVFNNDIRKRHAEDFKAGAEWQLKQQSSTLIGAEEIERLAVEAVKKYLTGYAENQIGFITHKSMFIKGYKASLTNRGLNDMKNLLLWLTRKESMYAVLYGDEEPRFCDNDGDCTTDFVLEQYLNSIQSK